MYRQFWQSVLISILLALGACFPVSLQHARDNAESQLAIKNADTATALALSLGLTTVDPMTAELAVSALFDTGHYELIRIVDPSGRIIVERDAPPEHAAAPEWFVRHLPLRAMEGAARINRGWRQFGTLTLVSHRGAAYDALWHGAIAMLGALLVAGCIIGLIGTAILRRIQRSAEIILRQAASIGEQPLVLVDEPVIPELRPLATRMRALATRLQAIFDGDVLRLNAIRSEANRDPLTGLANRIHFMARLRQVLEAENAIGGQLLMIHLADLTDINVRLGRPATDAFLKRCGEIIGRFAERSAGGIAARLDGADFAVMLPGAMTGHLAAKQLLADLVSTATPFGDGKAVAAISFGRVDPGIDLGALLSRLEGALSGAKLERRNTLREATPEEEEADASRTIPQCATMLNCAFDNQCASILSFPHRRVFRRVPAAPLSEAAAAQQKG